MRRRPRQASPRLLPRDATGGVQERLVTAGLVDRPEVTRVARRAEGDCRDAVAGVDVRVRKNAATGAGTTALQRQDARRCRDVQIVPLRIRRLVLQDHDRVGQVRILRDGARLQGDRRLEPVDRRHRHMVSVPDSHHVGVRVGHPELGEVAGAQVDGADPVPAQRADHRLVRTGHAADGPRDGGARKILDEVPDRLVMNARIAGWHCHQQFRPRQRGRIRRILDLSPIEIDPSAVQRQRQDGGQHHHRHGDEDNRLS